MAVTPHRPDIAAARASAKFNLGSGRELRRLEQMLSADETVTAMTQCRYQGCFGLAVLTDTRLLFLCGGVIWKVTEDVGLGRISHVQWRTVFGLGTLTVHVGAVALEFTGVSGPGGTAVVQGLRRQVNETEQVGRKVLEGILAMAAHVTAPVPESGMDGFPDEVPESHFLVDAELLPQGR